MVYKLFLETVKEQITEKLGSAYSLGLKQMRKNNGLILDALCIEKIGESISPSIHLNSFYQAYQEGTSMKQILNDITTLYQENSTLGGFEPEQLNSFEQIKGKIVYKLINTSANLPLLSEIPHIPYLDLSIVFYLLLNTTEQGQITTLIRYHHQNQWNLPVENLLSIAHANTPRLLPYQLQPIESALESYIQNHTKTLSTASELSCPLYLLTNTTGFYGACSILYDNLLHDLAQSSETDLIILPSSIHETLLLPVESGISYSQLSQTVIQINQAEVSPEEQLSNQVYCYRKDEKQISIIYPSSIPVGVY